MKHSTQAARGPIAARLERLARWILPFLVSGVLLAVIFERIDVRLALDFLTADVVLRFLGPLVAFNLATLAIDAQCLHRVSRADRSGGRAIARTTGARIKAACFLLGVLNYALGAAGVSVLLRRRAGASLAAAAGMVFLISLLDVGSVLVWVATGATLLETDAFGVRLGVVGGLVVAILAGFAFLRAPVSLGPLEAIRRWPILRAPREAPIGLLLEIGCLRLLFVGCFVLLTRGLFWAFGVEVSWDTLALNVGIMLVVSALPIAAGGLGTGQLVFVELFSGHASDPQLLSMSILFSLGIIVTRSLIGLAFAPEFAREALVAARQEGESP